MTVITRQYQHFEESSNAARWASKAGAVHLLTSLVAVGCNVLFPDASAVLTASTPEVLRACRHVIFWVPTSEPYGLRTRPRRLNMARATHSPVHPVAGRKYFQLIQRSHSGKQAARRRPDCPPQATPHGVRCPAKQLLPSTWCSRVCKTRLGHGCFC